jgi:hypothetical protein
MKYQEPTSKVPEDDPPLPYLLHKETQLLTQLGEESLKVQETAWQLSQIKEAIKRIMDAQR